MLVLQALINKMIYIFMWIRIFVLIFFYNSIIYIYMVISNIYININLWNLLKLLFLKNVKIFKSAFFQNLIIYFK